VATSDKVVATSSRESWVPLYRSILEWYDPNFKDVVSFKEFHRTPWVETKQVEIEDMQNQMWIDSIIPTFSSTVHSVLRDVWLRLNVDSKYSGEEDFLHSNDEVHKSK
jgi:hypothetical protein